MKKKKCKKEWLANRALAVRRWRIATKEALLKGFGEKCNKCGYNKYRGAFDFHHIRNRKYKVSDMMTKPQARSKIIEEVKKCILLCKNCHAELHYDIWKLNEIEIIKFDEAKLPEEPYKARKRKITFRKCLVCFKNYKVTHKNQKFCSYKCSNFASRKVIWPQRKILKEEIKEYSWRTLGKKYKVSDKTVKEWAIKYKLL